jgi:hypothetical protein
MYQYTSELRADELGIKGDTDASILEGVQIVQI